MRRPYKGGKLFGKMKVRGKVTYRVIDETGRIKKREPGPLRKMFKIPGKEMEGSNHNIITFQGDALLADWISKTPLQSMTMYMEVGTGWTGNSPKSNTGCNTPTGARMVMDVDYPQTKGVFGADDDNVTVFRATFGAGSLNMSGINEIALMNALTDGECLAYAQLVPEANVSENDTLQDEWEIIFLGN